MQQDNATCTQHNTQEAQANTKARKSIKAIVAGNAPSLQEIDYTRIPMEYETFRCNQFYLEDAYYLGKNIKAVSFAGQMLFEQIYTMMHLNHTQEYKIDSIVINNYPLVIKEYEIHAKRDFLLKALYTHKFIDTLYNGRISHNIGEFLEYDALQQLYYNKHVTSGIYMCAIAIAFGHKEIYIAGIDLYEGKSYAFDPLQKNILKVMPEFRVALQTQYEPKREDAWHTKEADLEALEFLAQTYNVRFYSLCPNSPISRYIPLAPITHNAKTPEKKPKNYTNDILLPPKHAYRTFRVFNDYIDYAAEPQKRRNRIKNNFYFRILSDLARLPSDIKHYFKRSKNE